MADFFVFLQSYISSFVKPIFAFLLDNRIATFLGTSLLTVAVGFFVIRFLYSVFISHPDRVGSAGFSSAVRFASTDRIDKTDGYSSAYRKVK